MKPAHVGVKLVDRTVIPAMSELEGFAYVPPGVEEGELEVLEAQGSMKTV